MKNKFVKILTVLSLLTATSYVQAEPHVYKDNGYIELGYGHSFPSSRLTHAVNDPANDDELFLKLKPKSAHVFKAAIGQRLDDARLELEYLYTHKHNLKQISRSSSPTAQDLAYSSHTSHHTVFVNGHYDLIGLNESIVPHIGAGIGFSRNHLARENITRVGGSTFQYYKAKNNNAFAWNLSAGTKLNLNEQVFIDLTYKFADFGKIKGSKTSISTLTGVVIEDTQNFRGKLQNHMVLLSVGYKF